MSEDMPGLFTFRPWRPKHESWEVYLAELETAYTQYRDRYRQGHETDPGASEPDPKSDRQCELTPPPP
jgi:hypothetical protein